VWGFACLDECLQVTAADPYPPTDPIRQKRPSLDPIPDRLLVEPKQLGDVGDGEEFFFHEIGLGGRVVAGLVPSDPVPWRHGAVMLSFVGAVSLRV
jgi:hypothetical protein